MCDQNNKKEPQQQETQETFPDSPSNDEAPLPDEAIIYTAEELQAMRDVRAKLTKEHGIEESPIGSIFLAVTTINCKLR
eukprot:13569831-Ditylum_brightwellii.AAC.1